MLRATLGVMRDLPRLHEITSVLIRHGLGDVVRRLGIANVLERAGQMLNWGAAIESERLEPAQRVRLALEELGPTFVKLGQVMATRVDLFPPHWIAEFEKLHSEVRAGAVRGAAARGRADARAPAAPRCSATSTRRPRVGVDRAGASRVAQDGTPVVLKIRRPGIRAKIEADLRILLNIADLIESEMPEARRYQPKQIAAQFARSLERELDLAREARNIERFGKNFEGNPYIVIPRVYRQWTSEVMNVQEYIDGVPGDGSGGGRRRRIRSQAARRARRRKQCSR